MKLMRRKEGQRGFTLIEIIAVLVLLGILAAVAVPRFMGMQDEARKKNAAAGVATIQSALSMAYASHLLNSDNPCAVGPTAILVEANNCIQLSDEFDPASITPAAATWTAAGDTELTIKVSYEGQEAEGKWKVPN